MTSDIRTSQIDEQEFLTFIYAFPLIILVAFGILSNILSIDTFRQQPIRTTPTGFYLIIYSYCSIFGLFMLEIRLLRMKNSVSYLTSFILCNIISVLTLIFARICLWMNGFLALQRVIYTFESNYLVNKFCSYVAIKKQILFIITLVFLMHIHDILYRISIPDPLLKGNFICQTEYSSILLILNQIFSLTHLFVPCTLNIIANILILASISHRRANLHQTTYWIQWRKHFRRHCHLFIAPTLIIICTLPQLILSLSFSCMNTSLKWLIRLNTTANFIIYIPQTVTFLIFILPCKTYFQVFQTHSYFRRLFFY